jgi:hypothetical protein
MPAVDPSTAIGSVFAAFGLSAAAGLNAWLPVFASALLDRLDVVDLGAPFDELSSTTGLVVLAALMVVDFVGDKVPVVDSALHAVGAVVAPVSGAVLFTGQTGIETGIPTGVAAVIGALLAGSVHGGRAMLRPVSTAGTAGTANPFLSLTEDAVSGVLTAVAFVLPVLAFLLVAGILVAVAAGWRRLARRRRPPDAPASAR